jgi:flagellar assembly factor FliW
MKCVTPIEIDLHETPASCGEASASCDVRLPMGLLGFEQIKDYQLTSNPGEDPFRWLRVKDNPSLAFVVVEPFIALPDYQPDIPQPDVQFLGLSQPEDALLYTIVTLHPGKPATINLKGPVVINRNTGVGKQVIIANASNYSVQHPLPVAEAAA